MDSHEGREAAYAGLHKSPLGIKESQQLLGTKAPALLRFLQSREECHRMTLKSVILFSPVQTNAW